jgi:hypothetical protein
VSRRAQLLIVITAGVLALAGCSSHSVHSSAQSTVGSGPLTAGERQAAQSALDGLQNSNISLQLVSITKWVQSVPDVCRVGVVSRNPTKFQVYVFWIPWLAAEPYAWLNMNLTNDPKTSTFHLGTVEPVLSGGRLERNGRKISPGSIDTTLLSRYGAQQAKKGQQILAAHANGVFAESGAMCQVLQNGSLRLVPNK